MSRWFRSGPATAPRYTIADTATIRMNWILGFTRAKQSYDELVTDAIWANPAAQNEIAKMLKGKSLPASGTTKSIGNLSDTTKNQHKDYVNFRAFTDGGSYGNYYGAYYGY